VVRTGKNRSRRIAACVALATLGLIGCGRSSRDSGAGGAGGHAGSESAVAGGGVSQGGEPSAGDAGSPPSPTGGGGDGSGARGGQPGMGGTAGNGGTGGVGTAGNAVAGGGHAGVAGSSAGAGGLAGAPSGEPGIVCGAYDHTSPDVACVPGEICVLCWDTETSGSVRCAPDPSARPADYDAFRATCTDPALLTECDGPEDCPDGTLCQVRADDDYAYAACSPEPPSCNAYCVACNSSADCMDGDSCVPNELGVRGWSGATCGPPLSELLPAGDWLIGWSGGLNHYSWFRFTQGDTSPDQGTVRTLPVTCPACEGLSCSGEVGTYEIVDAEVRLAFPSSCSLSFRLGSIASPAEPLIGTSSAVVSAQVFSGVSVGPLYQALLYAPAVACDADFTTCEYPPP
jgi:hypothetical protein